jgi:hypothetical protein
MCSKFCDMDQTMLLNLQDLLNKWNFDYSSQVQYSGSYKAINLVTAFYQDFLPLIVPRTNPDSGSTCTELLFGPDTGSRTSSVSSPNKNAVFSRFGPLLIGFPDGRKGDEDFGEEDATPEVGGWSGSSIQANDDCAILDRVGTGARGRSGISSASGRVSESTAEEVAVLMVTGLMAGLSCTVAAMCAVLSDLLAAA